MNNLKKGLGNNIFTLQQKYRHSETFDMKWRAMFKERSSQFHMDFSKGWYENRLRANLTFGLMNEKGNLGLVPPSLSFSSSFLQPYMVSSSMGLGSGLNFGVSKDPGAAGISLGYNVGVAF